MRRCYKWLMTWVCESHWYPQKDGKEAERGTFLWFNLSIIKHNGKGTLKIYDLHLF